MADGSEMRDVPPAPKRARLIPKACDPCKLGKRKCDGQLPCGYCSHSDKTCTYASVNRRRKQPSAGPNSTAVAGNASRPATGGQQTSTQHFNPPELVISTPRDEHSVVSTPQSGLARPPDTPPLARLSPTTDRRGSFGEVQSDGLGQTSPGPTADDNVTLALLAKAMANEQFSPDSSSARAEAGGDESVSGRDHLRSVTFLERVHRHLSVVFALRSFPRGQAFESEDGKDEPDLSSFFLPPQEEGLAYVRCYFEQAAATYRFLDRAHVEDLARRFYQGVDQVRNSSDDSALVLVVMAIGCLWTPSWNGSDPQAMTPLALQLFRASKRQLDLAATTPPRLTLIQVHLAIGLLHLGLARFQSAYLSLGTAGRLACLLGLHRRSEEASGSRTDELRRRTFWCSFMMDRYLSLVTGFPVLFDERDITQLYPSVPTASSVSHGVSDDARSLIGALAHIKLSRIMGHALRALQNPRALSPEERDSRVRNLEAELDCWLAETPDFFHPARCQDASHEVFTQVLALFQRQQRTVRSAYYFLKLFLYRTYLLDAFLDHLPTTGPSPSSSSKITSEIAACVEAAVRISQITSSLGNGLSYAGVFWNTAYFCFASLTVLLVYLMVFEDAPDRAEIEHVIENAMTGHVQLTGSTELEREQILKESRRITELIRQRSRGGRMSWADTGENAPLSGPSTFIEPMPSSSNVGEAVLTADTDWTTLWRDTEAVFQFGFDAAEFTFAPSPMTSTFDLGSDGLDGGHGGGGSSFMM